MKTYTIQPYREVDIESIFTIIRSRSVQQLADFPSFADLREILAAPEARDCAAVWTDETGRASGYVILILEHSYAGFVFEDTLHEPELLDEMIAWAWERCSDSYRGEAQDLYAGTTQAYPARIAALDRAGFILQPDSVVFMSRDLSESIAPASLPPGYSIRALDGEAGAPAWVALHRAAFGTENMTVEYRLAMMRLPDYEPELDLVAVTPDGSLAAYVLCSIDRAQITLSGVKTGTTDPVATHPNHQRRGLAKALLLAGLASLRERGMETARLSTASDNLAMQVAARLAGYSEVGRGLRFARPFALEGKT